jgi:peptidyl-prolyl cis-trans isomerase D
MITWMQTHKKWLIITIWIATIAFVGAGFVGWGAYSYGKKEDTVAKVKDTEISVKDVQTIYNQLFNQLNQAMGGKLDEATAKKFGLQKASFQRALTRAILIQFAKDNGIYITKEELAKAIISTPMFQTNGKFSDKLYKRFLAQINLTPKEYENSIRKDLMINKVLSALSTPAHKVTVDTIASAIFMQDRVSAKIINAPEISVNENEIKTFWQKNKDKYKSQTSYDIGYYYVPLNANVTEAELHNYYDEHKQNYTDENGKIISFKKAQNKVKTDLLASKTKRDAIITMKKLKRDEIKFNIAKNISIVNEYIDPDLMQKLIQTKFLKPVLTKKGWLIAKLIKVNTPKILSYEEAKKFAEIDLINQKRKEALINVSKEKIKTFTGVDLGFIGRDDIQKVAKKLNISIDEAGMFEQTLFNSKTATGYTLLPANNQTKSIIFKITAQKLLYTKKYKKYEKNVDNSANQLKQNTLEQNLIQKLMKLYESDIKMYMKI